MKILSLISVMILTLFCSQSLAQNTKVENFSAAKRILGKIYGKTSLKEETIYCGCKFNKKKVDLNSCGLKPRVKKGKAQYEKRIYKVEWEHIVPASLSTGAFKECRKSNGKKMSRRDCEKTSQRYRLLISDLYNLYPASGAINASRSNYQFAEISGEKREWGSCDFEIDSRKAEPRDSVKGDIARVYMYMHKAYPFVGFISKKNQKLFEVWDRQDPVDQEECLRYKLIKQYQQNENQILAPHCNK